MLIPTAEAKSVGDVGFSIPAILHTAKIGARGNVCWEYEASAVSDMQNQGMLFIKEWRELRGLTLQALGEALEPPASAGTIHTYESGKRKPSLDRLIDMGRVLNIPAGLLVDGPPGKDRSKAAGADTPPPALDTRALAKTLEVVQPFLSAAPGREDVRLEAADAIATLLDEIDSDPTILDDPERWAPVARVAAGHLRKLLGDSAVSDKRTQRHKSDNS